MQELLNTIILGKWEDWLPKLPDNSIDMALLDLPYNTTECDWDKQPVNLPALWKELKRIGKPRIAYVFTASQPFTTDLVNSNRDWFKYCWVWDKVAKGDVMNAKNKPMKQHEDIVIFSDGTTANKSNNRMVYFPIGVRTNTREANRQNQTEGAFKGLRPSHQATYKRQGTNYPSTILTFSNADHTEVYHPTQKPLPLFQYLILTYSRPGGTVLDCFAGSGTTAIAAHNTGRNFICIEQDATYHARAVKRLEQARAQLRFEEMVG